MKSQTKNYDVLVVGGGIFGLWVAKQTLDAGLNVALVEKDRIGAGASGGLLGALMPHIPTNWNAKKQFQFDALYELSDEISLLEEMTGKQTGYGRIGRLMPLREERFVQTAKTRELAAQSNWHQRDKRFDFSPSQSDRFEGWLSPDYAPFGFVLDSFAARVNPRLYLDALKTYVETRGMLLEGVAFHGFDNGLARLDGHDDITAGKVILAQGYETFDFLQKQFDLDVGTGIKGQSACFALECKVDHPVIYDDGVYIVPHEDGRCAVGSTSEKTWQEPSTPDDTQNGFLMKAFDLCPQLKTAPLLERWAGVRPKCYEREPIIGRLFEDVSIYIATGGFKVSFGIAHRVAKALVEELASIEPTIELPETFTVRHHTKAQDPLIYSFVR